MKAQGIVVAAGEGLRFKSDIPKPFALLNGEPLIVHSLRALAQSQSLESLIVVAHPQFLQRMQTVIEEFGCKKVRRIVPGGKTRRESVGRGLASLDDDTRIVAIHDGARPLVGPEEVNRAVEEAERCSAASLAVRVKPTIKVVDQKTMTVTATLQRQELWDVQTPQVFERSVIEQAHRQWQGDDPTDDSAMVEKQGVSVKVIEGSYRNIKITTREDLVFAEQLLF